MPKKPKKVDHTKGLDSLLAAIDSVGGFGQVLGKGAQIAFKALPTDNMRIDRMLGGGIPLGRVTEIYGPEGSAKTTLTLHLVASAQCRGGLAIFIDAEHALNLEYAQTIGVDLDTMLLSQPDNGEQALDMVDACAATGAAAIIVIDSVAALVPKVELEGTISDSKAGMAEQARMMSRALRRITTKTNPNTAIVFINQTRSKVGIIYGNPETTPGGKALKYYASCRLRTSCITPASDAAKRGGARIRIALPKSKQVRPFQQCEVDLVYGKGFDNVGALLDIAVEDGVVDKSGSWFSFNGERLAQGRLRAIEVVRNDPNWHKAIIKAVKG